MTARPMLVSQPALLVIDVPQGALMPGGSTGIPHVADHAVRTRRARAVIDAEMVGLRPDDLVIRKRRYSCFFGAELAILLKGLRAETMVLLGGLTGVCVHYTFVDGHQHDHNCRVVEDCIGSSGEPAHDASLRTMEYLQAGARRSAQAVIEVFAGWGRTDLLHLRAARQA